LAAAGIPIEIFSFARAHSPAATGFRLWSRLRKIAPDVVHCHDRYSNTFVVPLARLAGVPLVIGSRRWWTAMPGGFYRAGNRLAYRLAHLVIANSPAVGTLLMEEGVDRERIVIVPNFVDPGSFDVMPADAIAAARRRFGVPEGALVVTAVAILRPEKDLQSLIAAIALVRSYNPNVHLLLVGNGPCEAELRSHVALSGLQDHVHFAGYLPNSPNPHNYGDLSVLCSLHEGFPNSIVEAMAAGKAVVATNVGGIPDAVQQGKTGLLVPVGSPRALADAILRLAGDDDLRRRMGASARLLAQRSYRAEAVLEGLRTIYERAKT
jgi:glycosyltransferase involved in cell wall biosynthesis